MGFQIEGQEGALRGVPDSARITGNPNLTPLLPTHIVRRGRHSIEIHSPLNTGQRELVFPVRLTTSVLTTQLAIVCVCDHRRGRGRNRSGEVRPWVLQVTKSLLWNFCTSLVTVPGSNSIISAAGFPTGSLSPYPSYPTDNKPAVSRPFALGRFAFEDTDK
jgi:hypothetical protein